MSMMRCDHCENNIDTDYFPLIEIDGLELCERCASDLYQTCDDCEKDISVKEPLMEHTNRWLCTNCYFNQGGEAIA